MIEVKGLNPPTNPSLPSEPVRKLCTELMWEELQELIGAMIELQAEPKISSLVDVADGLADLLYVTLYTANAYGIDVESIFDEVQRSNMTKKGGPFSESGKQLKPETYEPPKLEPILLEQATKLNLEEISFHSNEKCVGKLLPDGSVVNLR